MDIDVFVYLQQLEEIEMDEVEEEQQLAGSAVAIILAQLRPIDCGRSGDNQAGCISAGLRERKWKCQQRESGKKVIGSKPDNLRSKSDGVLTGVPASLPEMQIYSEKNIYAYGKSPSG
ncbi:hypothetical protein B0H19DRAFT_1242296 [Mycena capillaripes]|nr:hypothetical protein B0H19DRAFT_1242296 [Mycena capillaripes]